MKAKDHPVIVVRRKKHGHAHHGGAWKVAYADFVTAMMAFFLVMWLAAQDSRVRTAIAGYFQEPGLLPFQQSNSMLAQGNGGIDSAGMPIINRRFNGQLEAEQKALVAAADHIRRNMASLPGFAELSSQVEFSVTTEGLRIELVDRSGSSFFDTGSSVLRGETEKILSIIAAEVGRLANDVVVEGHTDSRPYAPGDRYTNWELSSDRAHAARRVMTRSGLRLGQISAVRGFADTQLRMAADPLDPRNRRVSIVVRSQQAVEMEESIRGPAAAAAARATDPPPIAASPLSLPSAAPAATGR
jgi:chemotaxis protein MotB